MQSQSERLSWFAPPDIGGLESNRFLSKIPKSRQCWQLPSRALRASHTRIGSRARRRSQSRDRRAA